jgi:hypothetical protein
MAGVAQLKAMVGLDTKAYQAGANRIQGANQSMASSLKSIAATFGVAFSVAAITRGIKALVDYAGNLSLAARNAGLLTEEMLALNNIAVQNGMKFDDVGRLVAKMSTRIYDAIKGNKEYEKSFTDIGLNINDLIRMDPAQQIEAVARAAMNSKIPLEAMAEIFGERLGPKAVEFMKQLAKEGIGEVNDATADGIEKARMWSDAYAQGIEKIKAKLVDLLAKTVDLFNISAAGWKAMFTGGSALDAVEERKKLIQDRMDRAREKRKTEQEKKIKTMVDIRQQSLEEELAKLTAKQDELIEKATASVKAPALNLSQMEKAGAGFDRGMMLNMKSLVQNMTSEKILQEQLKVEEEMLAEIIAVKEKIEQANKDIK